MSRQSFAICPKIKEIDEFLLANPQYRNKLVESHPELCFAQLNSGTPIHENKKSDNGLKVRINLLSRHYNKTQAIVNLEKGNYKLKNCLDDVIDALCLAVTGMMSSVTGLSRIPENPMANNRGLVMQMVVPLSRPVQRLPAPSRR